MGFELKNEDKSAFKANFNDRDFNDTNFKENAFEVTIPFGQIKAKQWYFDGIKIMYSETQLEKPAELDWKGDSELVTMHFNLQGRTSINQAGMAEAFELNGNQHNLFYGTSAEGKMKFDELMMKSFMIQFSKDSFLSLSKDGNESLRTFADKIVSGKPVAFSDNNLTIDLPLQNCINSFLNCSYSDSLKKMFFLSKTIEMLVLQAESFDKTLRSTSYLKSDYDKERILFARDYLLKNAAAPPSLVELSKIAGINEYKLKKGFKELFNQTAFAYLADVKLELAKHDLLEGKKQATGIAFELGYSSLQHFSSAFKKKFGISPSQVK